MLEGGSWTGRKDNSLGSVPSRTELFVPRQKISKERSIPVSLGDLIPDLS